MGSGKGKQEHSALQGGDPSRLASAVKPWEIRVGFIWPIQHLWASSYLRTLSELQLWSAWTASVPDHFTISLKLLLKSEAHRHFLKMWSIIFQLFSSSSLQDQRYFYWLDVQGFQDTEVIYEDGTELKSFIPVLKSGVTAFCWNTVLWCAIKYSITYLIEWKNKFSSASPLCCHNVPFCVLSDSLCFTFSKGLLLFQSSTISAHRYFQHGWGNKLQIVNSCCHL